MKSVIRCIFALFFLSTHIGLSAQSPVEADSFKLVKQGSHYVFSADINGKAEAKLLLESGIPAMLADSSFVVYNRW